MTWLAIVVTKISCGVVNDFVHCLMACDLAITAIDKSGIKVLRSSKGEYIMSETANMALILERLATVERENRKLKSAAIGVLVLIAGVILVGAAMPKNEVIEAKQFVVKDDNGIMRAALGYNEMGPALVLFGPEGKLSVSLSSASDASGLSVFDSAGRPRAGLTCGASGYPGLTLMNQAGIVRAALGCSEAAKGIPLLAFMDEAGNPIYSIPRY